MNKEMKKGKRIWDNLPLKCVIILFAIVCLTFLTEIICFNGSIFFEREWKGIVRLDDPTSVSEEVVGDSKIITIKVNGHYINKLFFDYELPDHEETYEVNIVSRKISSFGSIEENVISDTLSSWLTQSVTHIGEKPTEIMITLPKEIKIDNYSINNSVDMNGYRVVFLFILFINIAIIFLCKSWIVENLHYLYGIIGITVGIVFILFSPIYAPYGWDDEVHFNNAYQLLYGEKVEYTQAIDDYLERNTPNYNTKDERVQIEKILNSKSNISRIEENSSPQLASWGYIGGSITMAIGKALNLSFTNMMRFGKLGVLLVYLLLTMFAIKMIPVGKRILFVISLMPTAMFQATLIVYDSVVIAGLFLGFAMIVKELLTPKVKISSRNILIFLGVVSLACFPKAVYAPFLLLPLLLPKEKFYSKRQQRYFQVGLIMTFLILMSTFVLPATTNQVEADLRGGMTNVGEQMKYIFTHPFVYTKLLLSSMWTSLGEFSIGNMALLNYAHVGVIRDNYAYIAILLVSFVSVTDTRWKKECYFTKWQRGAVVFIGFAIISLIWTAMYLAFTPVQYHVINGVQGRYFIPILAPLIISIMMGCKRIKLEVSDKWYNRVIGVSSLIVLMGSIYNIIFTSYLL